MEEQNLNRLEAIMKQINEAHDDIFQKPFSDIDSLRSLKAIVASLYVKGWEVKDWDFNMTAQEVISYAYENVQFYTLPYALYERLKADDHDEAEDDDFEEYLQNHPQAFEVPFDGWVYFENICKPDNSQEIAAQSQSYMKQMFFNAHDTSVQIIHELLLKNDTNGDVEVLEPDEERPLYGVTIKSRKDNNTVANRILSVGCDFEHSVQFVDYSILSYAQLGFIDTYYNDFFLYKYDNFRCRRPAPLKTSSLEEV